MHVAMGQLRTFSTSRRVKFDTGGARGLERDRLVAFSAENSDWTVLVVKLPVSGVSRRTMGSPVFTGRVSDPAAPGPH